MIRTIIYLFHVMYPPIGYRKAIIKINKITTTACLRDYSLKSHTHTHARTHVYIHTCTYVYTDIHAHTDTHNTHVHIYTHWTHKKFM